MKKLLLVGAVAAVALASCDGKKTTETTMTDSVAGQVFEGVFPMADTEGDTVKLTLNGDSTFVCERTSDSIPQMGVYTLADTLLTTVAGTDTTFYSYTPDSVVLLDMYKQRAASGLSYVLKKK